MLPERMAQAAVLRAQNRAAHKVSTHSCASCVGVYSYYKCSDSFEVDSSGGVRRNDEAVSSNFCNDRDVVIESSAVDSIPIK